MRRNPGLVSDSRPSVLAKAVNGWMGRVSKTLKVEMLPAMPSAKLSTTAANEAGVQVYIK